MSLHSKGLYTFSTVYGIVRVMAVNKKYLTQAEKKQHQKKKNNNKQTRNVIWNSENETCKKKRN